MNLVSTPTFWISIIWFWMILCGWTKSMGNFLLPSILNDVKLSVLIVNGCVISKKVVSLIRLLQAVMNTPGAARSKRKRYHPTRLYKKICNNSSCEAQLKLDEAFCKRCSCYICFQYDENKNSSFWSVCESEDNLQDKPCGLSCHLKCALKNERSGNLGNSGGKKLDGSFKCGNCGTVNDLISCWRKLMKEAKEVQSFSELRSRICLCHMILDSSKKYQDVHKIVDSIKWKLENEVGSLDNLPSGMPQNQVDRLFIGNEVQKLCSQAIELLDRILLPMSQTSPIESHNCEGRQVIKSSLEGGICPPLLDLRGEQSKSKIIPIIDLDESSENHEHNHNPMSENHREYSNSADAKLPTCDLSVHVSSSVGMQGRKSSEEKPLELRESHEMKHLCGYTETKFHQAVRVIRKLELDGHVDGNFRKEFITWLSCRASEKSEAQINVIIDTLSDDSQTLADQLVHTFGEDIRAQKLHVDLNFVE